MNSAQAESPRFWQIGIAGPFLLVTLIWGSTWLVIKDQVGNVPPGWSITWRFVLAAAGMALLAVVRGESLKPDRRMLLLAAMIGIPQFALNFQFVYNAERFLASGVVAVVFALLLVPNALLARLFFGAPVSRRFLVGGAIAIAGIALLAVHEIRSAPAGQSVGLGIAFTLGGLLSASVGNVVQAGPLARGVKTVPVLAWAMLLGALVDAGLALALEGWPRIDWRWGYLGGIAYLGLIGSVVTFPMYFRLLQVMGAGGAAYSSVLVPVVAMALSTLFEHYQWTPLAAAGSALALAGLVVALRAKG